LGKFCEKFLSYGSAVKFWEKFKGVKKFSKKVAENCRELEEIGTY
jgi:hypothetical protein